MNNNKPDFEALRRKYRDPNGELKPTPPRSGHLNREELNELLAQHGLQLVDVPLPPITPVVRAPDFTTPDQETLRRKFGGAQSEAGTARREVRYVQKEGGNPKAVIVDPETNEVISYQG